MPHTFFAPDLTPATPTYTLPEDESKHAVRVLRLSEGDAVVLVNGRGGVFGAEVADANPKRCQLRVVRAEQVPPRSFRVHLAVAPTKNLDRMEWLVEKATEIGVDTITFLRCARSERRDLKLERLEKIAVSALKQSGQAWLPQLVELTDYTPLSAYRGARRHLHCPPRRRGTHAPRPGSRRRSRLLHPHRPGRRLHPPGN